jgi:flagellar basal-body rod protein FlgC
MDAYDITASALTAQRLRMDTIASNLANVNTTRKADGSVGAYHRRNVIFAPILEQANSQFASGGGFSPMGGGSSFAESLPMMPSKTGISMGPDGTPMLHASVSTAHTGGAGVQVLGIDEDSKTPMRMIFDPGNPDADAKGYVEMPNVNVVTEMVDMISASRAYEANVTALQSAKGMAQSALEL